MALKFSTDAADDHDSLSDLPHPTTPTAAMQCAYSAIHALVCVHLLQAVDSSIVDLENLRRTTEADQDAAAAAAAEEARLRGVITKSR